MRWLLVLACACSSKSDCEVVAAKVRPVIQRMMVAAGKPIDDAELDKIVGESCAKEKAGEPRSAGEQRLRDCVLAATSETETTACLEAEFKAYRDDSAASLERSKARMDKLRAERDELDRELAKVPVIADAAPADAAIDARPSVDVATLPAWPIPAGVHGKGPEVEIAAIDTDVDQLLLRLWDPAQPLLAPVVGGTVTGRVVAPSKAAAFAALAAQVGFTPPRTVVRGGKGANVTFSFAGAPANDLFRVLADTLHLNAVVMPGEMPKLDIAMEHVPADAVLTALAAMVDREIVKAGKIMFVVAKGTKLPPVPKLKSSAIVSLAIHDGTVEDAVAALAAVTKLDVRACGASTLNLHLVKLPLADVVRAIEAEGDVTFTSDATCAPIAEAKLDPKAARLVATASAGTNTAAVVAHGKTSTVVRPDGKISIASDSIEVDPRTTLYFHDLDFSQSNVADFVASLKRTSAVIRTGASWAAVVETTKQPVVFQPHAFGIPFELMQQFTISAKGVELAIDPQHRIVIPLAK